MRPRALRPQLKRDPLGCTLRIMERARINRPVTPDEIAVIRTALKRASKSPSHAALADGLDQLRAISQCGCGCDSVDFVEHDPKNRSKPIADATGKTKAGGDVGVLVWGTESQVTGLEIYDLGAGDADLKLPVPDSITAFVGGAA